MTVILTIGHCLDIALLLRVTRMYQLDKYMIHDVVSFW